MEKQFSLSDQVIARVAQIVQEGMMMGIDVVDLFRQVRVREDGTGALVLTEDYKRQVQSMHDKLLADAERLAQASGDQSAVDSFRLFKE